MIILTNKFIVWSIFHFCNIACDLIRAYRHAHLQEQSQTRDFLNRNRELARNKKQILILGDFMSDWATKLPHIRSQGNRTSKEDAGLNIGCRLYAAEVIYGDKLEGFICYLVPGHLPGGKLCNTMILTLFVYFTMNNFIRL